MKRQLLSFVPSMPGTFDGIGITVRNFNPRVIVIASRPF
jgi:hypothetical protein